MSAMDVWLQTSDAWLRDGAHPADQPGPGSAPCDRFGPSGGRDDSDRLRGRHAPGGSSRLGRGELGLGHGTMLVLLGLPLVLLGRALPERVQSLTEAAVGAIIILLAARLLVRWRHGHFHAHTHSHGGTMQVVSRRW